MSDLVFIYGMWLFWVVFGIISGYALPIPDSLFLTMGASGLSALCWHVKIVYGRGVGQLGMYYFFCHILPALITFILSLFIFLVLCVYHSSMTWFCK
jgi:hypothetical protein